MASPSPSHQHFLKLAVTKGIIDRGLAREIYQEAQRSGRDPSAIMLERGILSPYIAETLRADVAKILGPRIIGGFRITGKLGEGGMGTVYRAVQVSVNRPVALKVLAENLTTNVEFTARFLREAYAAAKVAHGNVVTVFDAGRDDKQLYLAMELVTGGDADQLMKANGGRLRERRALEIIRDAARGLGAIAKAGLIHRDIKPSNILLTDEGEGKLGDLGLARTEDGEDRRTRTGTILGTPAFMSPEQADGAAELDIRADIYSLGATLYTLVAGCEPFTGSSPYAIVGKLLTTPFPDPQAAVPGLSAATTDLILKATLKDRLQRFQTPAEFAAAIEQALAMLPAEPPAAKGAELADTRHSTDLLPPMPAADSLVVGGATAEAPPLPAAAVRAAAAADAARKPGTARQAQKDKAGVAVATPQAEAVHPVTVGPSSSDDDWDLEGDPRPSTSAVAWARPNLTAWGRSPSIGGGIVALRPFILPGLLVAVVAVLGIVWFSTGTRPPVGVVTDPQPGPPTPAPPMHPAPPHDDRASVHAAELRAKLAVLDHDDPVPAGAADDLDALAALPQVGDADPVVARWRAKVAEVAALKGALASFFDPQLAFTGSGTAPDAVPPFDPAQKYGRLVELVGRADIDVVRWSALFAPQAVAWAADRGHDQYGAWADLAVPGATVRMRWCPPGRFTMGCDDTEAQEAWENARLVTPDAQRADFDAPQHAVALSRGFWLAESECTRGFWQAVTGSDPSTFKVDPARPVEHVSWNACQDFLAKLAALAPGAHAALPTEAQWEYACRAGTSRALWTGPLAATGANDAQNLDPIAWYPGNCMVTDVANATDVKAWTQKQYAFDLAATHPVKGKAANPWGLYDMLGNVAEWCADPLVDYPKRGWSATDPVAVVPAGPDVRYVVRGGAWAPPGAARCRAAARFGFNPTLATNWVGLRICVADAPVPVDAGAATVSAPK